MYDADLLDIYLKTWAREGIFCPPSPRKQGDGAARIYGLRRCLRTALAHRGQTSDGEPDAAVFHPQALQLAARPSGSGARRARGYHTPGTRHADADVVVGKSSHPSLIGTATKNRPTHHEQSGLIYLNINFLSRQTFTG